MTQQLYRWHSINNDACLWQTSALTFTHAYVTVQHVRPHVWFDQCCLLWVTFSVSALGLTGLSIARVVPTVFGTGDDGIYNSGLSVSVCVWCNNTTKNVIYEQDKTDTVFGVLTNAVCDTFMYDSNTCRSTFVLLNNENMLLLLRIKNLNNCLKQ